MNKEETLKIVQKNGSKLKELPDHFKKDKEIVLAAIKDWVLCLQFADKSLKKDKEFVLEVIKKKSGDALEFVDDSLKKDREIVLQAVTNIGWSLQYADESFKKDKELVLIMIKDDGNNIQYAHESFRKDKEIVLEAVKKSGNALEFVDDSFKKDKEIVKLAIIENQEALLHADKELQNDSEFIKKMIKANGFIIDSLAELKNNLAEDKEIILEAYKTAKHGFTIVGTGHKWWQGRSIEWIQKNQDFVSMVVKDKLSNFLSEKPDLELKKFTKDNYVHQSAVLICKILDVLGIKSLDPKKIVKKFENNKKESDEVTTINDSIFTIDLTISELSLAHDKLSKSVVKSFGAQFGTLAVFGEDDKNHFLNHYSPDFKMAVEFAEKLLMILILHIIKKIYEKIFS